MTWYLKYRPQTISELDLEQARQMLGQLLGSGRQSLPHAFLFCGPRGTGKTSAARIVAKAVNCQKPARPAGGPKSKGEPCNECGMCLAITHGSALDVIEIDAASNRGIDEMRQLREKIKLAPIEAKYKVYIIDEVHMLTTEAANALLKTLEEPPPHAIFILCTTEERRLPETVVSRCTRVPFKAPTLAEIVGKLAKVAKGEAVQMSQADLQLVAHEARGSFRDAIKILEQVVLSGLPVRQVLGLLEAADPAEFVALLQSGQTQKSLAMINHLVEQGVNLRGFIERCVEAVREELLAKWGDDPLRTNLLRLVEGFEEAYVRTRDAAVPQLPLEIFVIEMTTNPKLLPGPRHPRGVHSATPGVSQKLAEVVAKWPQILKTVKPKNHSVEALLRSTRPLEFDGRKLQLEVFYKFHKDKLEADKCRRLVEEAIGEVLGVDGVSLILQLGQKPAPKEEVGGEVDEDIVRAAAEIFKVEAV